MSDPVEHRRPFRYGLRWLFALMLGACILFGWMAYELKLARERQRLVEQIQFAGGKVADELTSTSAPKSPGGKTRSERIRPMFGEDFAANVVLIDLASSGENFRLFEIAQQGGLARLTCFERLKSLAVPAGTGGADLEPIGRLRTLESLSLQGAHVTDESMAQVGRLARLQRLDLDETGITDRGLAACRSLTQLRRLSLRGCADHVSGTSRHRAADLARGCRSDEYAHR